METSTPVPSLLPETEEEKKDYMEAEQRRNERLDRRKKRRAVNDSQIIVISLHYD